MKTTIVALGERSYTISIAPGILAKAGGILVSSLGSNLFIVTNPTVAEHYLQPLTTALAADGRAIRAILVPDGESFKNSETLDQIYTSLIESGADRKSTLIALGGGVIGDLTGYAAATYQRGVPFVQIPTTLLAQVDSSVGGKTGVNHPLGKNMIGAFHQPRAVLVDTMCLRTLPKRELAAGLAEIIKYGLIHDAEFFCWLEHNIDALLELDPEALSHSIERSCQIKARVVAGDERERGERALLNLGHTFGHAIEAGLGFGTWLHGEAVAAGMVLAAELSCRLGSLDAATVQRTRTLLDRAGLPTTAPALGSARYRELMQRDKKVEGGSVRLVLLNGLGRAVVRSDVPEPLLSALLQDPSCCA